MVPLVVIQGRCLTATCGRPIKRTATSAITDAIHCDRVSTTLNLFSMALKPGGDHVMLRLGSVNACMMPPSITVSTTHSCVLAIPYTCLATPVEPGNFQSKAGIGFSSSQ